MRHVRAVLVVQEEHRMAAALMSDSFFTSQNHVDPQLERATQFFCQELLEASARRIVKLEGPLEAAKRLQRLADICAGAYVLPLDHWRLQQGSSETAPTRGQAGSSSEGREDAEADGRSLPGDPLTQMKQPRRERIWKLVADNPALAFLAGYFLGLYWEALWR